MTKALHFSRPPDKKKESGERGDGLIPSLEFEACYSLRQAMLYIDDSRPDAGMCVLSWLSEQTRECERHGEEGQAQRLAEIAAMFKDLYQQVEHVHTLLSIVEDKKMR